MKHQITKTIFLNIGYGLKINLSIITHETQATRPYNKGKALMFDSVKPKKFIPITVVIISNKPIKIKII